MWVTLTRIRDEAEKRIKSELSGFGGLLKRPLYNSRMPLSVLIFADEEEFELIFRQDGDVELREGLKANPDMIIESDVQTIERLFDKPRADEFRQLQNQRKIRITAVSTKGRETESYIRSFLRL